MTKFDFIQLSLKYDDFSYRFKYFEPVEQEELDSRSYKFPFDTHDLEVIDIIDQDKTLILIMDDESRSNKEINSDDLYMKINYCLTIDDIVVKYNNKIMNLTLCDIAYSESEIIFEIVDNYES